MARGKRVEIVKITVDEQGVASKKCTKCCEVKALTEFPKHPSGIGRRNSRCRKCCVKKSAGVRVLKSEIVYVCGEGETHVYKKCGKCLLVKSPSEFYRDRKGSGGLSTVCKLCEKSRGRSRTEGKARLEGREARKNNTYVLLDFTGTEEKAKKCLYCGKLKILSEYYPEAKGLGGRLSYCIACHKERSHLNKDVETASRLRYRAAKKALPNRWGQRDRRNILKCFNGSCALTQANTQLHLDHFIPIATGHMGTVVGNVVPLSAIVNQSKSDSNPFEWFEANRQRFELSQSAFDALVAKLAQQNGLTPEEFRDFTYWCFANPRSLTQIRRDNARYGCKKPSLELWREAIGVPFPIAVNFGNTAHNNGEEVAA